MTLVSEVSARSKNPRPNIHQRSTNALRLRSKAKIYEISLKKRNLFQFRQSFLSIFTQLLTLRSTWSSLYSDITFGYRRDFLRITLQLTSDNFGNSFGINFGLTSGLTSGSISTLTTNKEGSSNVTSSR